MLYVSKNNTRTAYAMISQQLIPDSSLRMTLFPIPIPYSHSKNVFQKLSILRVWF